MRSAPGGIQTIKTKEGEKIFSPFLFSYFHGRIIQSFYLLNE